MNFVFTFESVKYIIGCGKQSSKHEKYTFYTYMYTYKYTYIYVWVLMKQAWLRHKSFSSAIGLSNGLVDREVQSVLKSYFCSLSLTYLIFLSRYSLYFPNDFGLREYDHYFLKKHDSIELGNQK